MPYGGGGSGILGIIARANAGSDRQRDLESDVERQRRIEQNRLDMERAELKRKETEFAKALYLQNIAQGLPQTTSEDMLLNAKTSGPLATTAANLNERGRAEEELKGMSAFGEAQRSANGFVRDQNIFNQSSLRSQNPIQEADVMNASRRAAEAGFNRKFQGDTGALDTEGLLAESANLANIAGNRSTARREQERFGNIPQEIGAEGSTYPVTTARNKLEGERIGLVKPEDLLQERQVITSQADAVLQLNKLKLDFPELFENMNQGTPSQYPLQSPNLIPGYGIRGRGQGQVPTTALTPGGVTLPVAFPPGQQLQNLNDPFKPRR